ncbi:MAG: IS66 family transposase [Steroidobacteraceae bacterium]
MLPLSSVIQGTSDSHDELSDLLARSEEENRRLKERNARLESELEEHLRVKERNALLEEELRWLKGKLFGRSSEKSSQDVSPDQKMLFNEAEVLAAIAAADQAQAERTISIGAHERKARPHTGGREPIPAHLPRIEVPHDLSAQAKWCTHENVCWAMQRIGEEVSERYHYEPPKLTVERHVTPKYSCPHCHGGVHRAAVPATILPKSNASASLLAHLVTGKFVDGLPLYRLCRQLERQQVQLSPTTVGSWIMALGGEKVIPLINLLNEQLLAWPFVQMDETYLQVLRSQKAPSSQHYMVVRAAGPPGRRIILFDYLASRTGEALASLLTGIEGPYCGKLLTDGLEQYDGVAARLKLLHFGCLQHCRTHFHKAAKVTEIPSGRSLARVGLEEYLGPIFHIEQEIKELREKLERAGESLPLEEVHRRRQALSAPIFVAFRDWVDKLTPAVPPKSALGNALSYTIHQWPKLVLHLDHPEVPCHNNYLENQIRPFAQGRRMWLFANNPNGARASANLYSLVSTARANALEPYAYLRRLFEQLPAATTVEAIEALLPFKTITPDSADARAA